MLLVASACLCFGSFLLVTEAGLRRPHRLSGTLVLSLAVLVILSLATGTMRRYEAGALLLASLGYVLLAALTGLLLRRRQPSSGAAGAASPAVPAVPDRQVRSPGIGRVANSIFGLLLLVNAAEYAWRSVLAVRLQPLGYDPLYYHLINITQWVRYHALVDPFVDLAPGSRDPGALTQADSFPKNAELVGGWIAVFTRSMAGVGMTQILFVAMLGISVTGVCRALEIRADLARIAGALTCLCPAVVAQSDQLYVDIARTAPVVAAFQFVLVAYPAGPGTRGSRIEARPVALVLAGLALGFAVGVKASNLLFLMVIPVVAIGLAFARVRMENLAAGRDAGSSLGLRNSLALLLAPAGVIGSYWYLRSWTSWGSPFWPYVTGPFGGRSSFDGAYAAILKSSYHTHSAFWALLKSWWAATSLYDGQIPGDEFVGGLGLLWLVAGIPAVLLLLFHNYWNRRAAFAVVLPLLLGTLLSPAPYNTRYSIPLAVCGVVAMAAVLDAGTAGRWRKAGPTVPSRAGGRPPRGRRYRQLTALGATGFTAIATVISVLAISDAWAATRIGNWPNVGPTGTFPSLRFEIAAVGAPRTERARFGYVGAYADTMGELDPREPVAFFADQTPLMTYPLLGPDLQRDLVVLSAPADLAGALLARRDGLRYLYLPSYSPLIAKLPAQHAKLVGPVLGGFVFDLSPPPLSLKPALPNKDEVSVALPGPLLSSELATVESVLVVVSRALSGGCTKDGVGADAMTWRSGAPYMLSAAACQYTNDATPDRLSRAIIDRLYKSRYALKYNSESRLTQVFEKPTRGHLDAVIIVRLLNRLEVIKVVTSLNSHNALVAMAINVTKRFAAIR